MILSIVQEHSFLFDTHSTTVGNFEFQCFRSGSLKMEVYGIRDWNSVLLPVTWSFK